MRDVVALTTRAGQARSIVVEGGRVDEENSIGACRDSCSTSPPPPLQPDIKARFRNVAGKKTIVGRSPKGGKQRRANFLPRPPKFRKINFSTGEREK